MNGLSIDLPVASASDRLLVISAGGPSYGEYLVIFRRNRAGKYRQTKEDLSELAWAELARKREGMKGARPVHLYCRIISVTEKPDEVTFSMGGDYRPLKGPGQVPLTTAFFRYRIEQPAIVMISQPDGWKLE